MGTCCSRSLDTDNSDSESTNLQSDKTNRLVHGVRVDGVRVDEKLSSYQYSDLNDDSNTKNSGINSIIHFKDMKFESNNFANLDLWNNVPKSTSNTHLMYNYDWIRHFEHYLYIQICVYDNNTATLYIKTKEKLNNVDFCEEKFYGKNEYQYTVKDPRDASTVLKEISDSITPDIDEIKERVLTLLYAVNVNKKSEKKC